MKLEHSKQAPDEGGAPGAAAPAPASPAPAAAPASGESPEAKWDELSDEDFELELPAGDAPAPADPAPAKAGSEPAPAAATPEPPKPATPEPPKPESQVPPVDPAVQEAQVKAATEELHKRLSGVYETELDEDTKSALLSDPATVMPRLMARAAMDGARLALSQIPNMVPLMVEQTTSVSKARESAWAEFDKAHEDLAKPEYRQTVVNAVKAVKALGKNLSKEESLALVGRTARAMLNLPEPQARGGAAAPSAPAAPFVPIARGAAAPASPAKAKPTDKWADLSTEDE